MKTTQTISTNLLRVFVPPSHQPSTASVWRSILWPLAIMSIIHRSVVLTLNGNITDDFKPVYRAVRNFRYHLDLYNEHFNYVDPHYLYPPGGTLLMSPLGFLPETLSRYSFIFVNVIAILVSAHLLLKIFHFGWSSVAAPALLSAMFVTESVSSTLVFTNVNGIILLGELVFLFYLLRGGLRQQYYAGTAIGLTLVIKPLLGPLLLIPLLNRQWRILITALCIPLVFNLLALPLISDSRDFFTGTLPYMLGTRDYFNSSVLGNGVYFGLPMWLITGLRIAFVLLAGMSMVLLTRYYRERNQLFWVLTSSGVLLLTSFLVLSLGQGYYSIVLFPFIMTVVLPNSVLRNWPSWLGIYGFLTLDKWLIFRWMFVGRPLDYLKITYGWSLVLIVTTVVLYYRYLDARSENRLAEGIDPLWYLTLQAKTHVSS